MLLDDIFSGLDPVTEETIFQSLLGANGILRKESIAVVLATHAVHLLPSADLLVVLGDGGIITYQGAPANLPPNLVSMRDVSTIGEKHGSRTDDSGVRGFSVDLEDTEISLNPELTTTDAATADASRQTGDLRVYWYYLKTMGLKHTLLFAILGAICMGFGPAQSMLQPTPESCGGVNFMLMLMHRRFVAKCLGK
jgi:ATP-binding cassette subfamily C (CFTR/MRP) protein 1